MTPKGKTYKKEYAAELLRIAKGDLGSARDLMEGKQGRPENVCYLTQQAIEKALKAVLCHLEKRLIHTHDMEALLALMPEGTSPPDAFLIRSLTEYATVRRYEEGYEILEKADLKNFLELGEKVLSWADGIILSSGTA